METLGVIQYDSGLPLSGLRYVGDLRWIQRRMLNFRQIDNRYNHTVFDKFEISEILRTYTDRDCKYIYIYFFISLIN